MVRITKSTGEQFPCLEIRETFMLFYLDTFNEFFFEYSYNEDYISIKVEFIDDMHVKNDNLVNIFKEIKESYNPNYDKRLFDMYIEQLKSITSIYDGFYKIVEAEMTKVIECYFNKGCKK